MALRVVSVGLVERERGGTEGIGGEPLLSVRLLEGLLPRDGRELEDTVARPVGQEAEEIAQVAHGSRACRRQLASNDTKVVLTSAASSVPTESQFLPADHLTAKLALADVVMKRQPAILEKARERVALVARVADRCGEGRVVEAREN